MKKRNVYITCGHIAVYLLIYLIGRMIWCDIGESNLIGWLFTISPAGEHSYLYGWLLSSNLFWYALAISALPSLWVSLSFRLLRQRDLLQALWQA